MLKRTQLGKQLLILLFKLDRRVRFNSRVILLTVEKFISKIDQFWDREIARERRRRNSSQLSTVHKPPATLVWLFPMTSIDISTVIVRFIHQSQSHIASSSSCLLFLMCVWQIHIHLARSGILSLECARTQVCLSHYQIIRRQSIKISESLITLSSEYSHAAEYMWKTSVSSEIFFVYITHKSRIVVRAI